MAIFLVTYDLKQPGQVYEPVWEYFKRFNRCKGLESVYLIETSKSASTLRDELKALVDGNDKVFVVQITRNADWAAFNYGCGVWLNSPDRSW